MIVTASLTVAVKVNALPFFATAALALSVVMTGAVTTCRLNAWLT